MLNRPSFSLSHEFDTSSEMVDGLMNVFKRNLTQCCGRRSSQLVRGGAWYAVPSKFSTWLAVDAPISSVQRVPRAVRCCVVVLAVIAMKLSDIVE